MSGHEGLSLGLFRGSALLGAALAIGVSAGCTVFNTNHCAYKADGVENSCPSDHVCSVCAVENNGCVPMSEIDSVAPSCLESAGSTTTAGTVSTDTTGPTSTSNVTDTTTTSTTTTVGETLTTTDPVTSTDTSTTTATTTTTDSTTGEPICDPSQNVQDPDCSDPSPYCVGLGVCGPCGQLGQVPTTCADVDANKPVCDDASGRCVQCTKEDTSACPPATPGCDEETGQCAKCTEHSECPETACDYAGDGTCFPEDSVIYVENNLAKCQNGDGTVMKPYCNLSVASGALMPGKRTTIKVKAATSAMLPLVLADPGYVLAIVAADAQIPILDGKNSQDPTVDVSPDSRVYLYRLKIQFSKSPSVLACTGGELYLDDLRLEGDGVNAARALDASSCDVGIRRSFILRNAAGLQINNGSLSIENTFISENGRPVAAFGGFNFLGTPTVKINYSTIVGHPQTSSTSTFKCAMGNMNVTIRNSAVLGIKPLQSAECAAAIKNEMSLIEEGMDAAEVTSLQGQWFGIPLDGAYPAKKGGPLKDIAQWDGSKGDPKTDYNFTARPTGGPGYAGADEPL